MEAGLIPESTWHIRARTHTLSPHPPTHNIQLCQATNLAAGSSSRLILAHTHTHTHTLSHTHIRTHTHTCSALMTEFNPFPLLALEPTIHRRQLPKGCGFKHLRSFCHVIALLRTHTHAGAKCVAVLEKGYGVCVSLCLCVQVCVCARVLKITLC